MGEGSPITTYIKDGSLSMVYADGPNVLLSATGLDYKYNGSTQLKFEVGSSGGFSGTFIDNSISDTSSQGHIPTTKAVYDFVKSNSSSGNTNTAELITSKILNSNDIGSYEICWDGYFTNEAETETNSNISIIATGRRQSESDTASINITADGGDSGIGKINLAAYGDWMSDGINITHDNVTIGDVFTGNYIEKTIGDITLCSTEGVYINDGYSNKITVSGGIKFTVSEKDEFTVNDSKIITESDGFLSSVKLAPGGISNNDLINYMSVLTIAPEHGTVDSDDNMITPYFSEINIGDPGDVNGNPGGGRIVNINAYSEYEGDSTINIKAQNTYLTAAINIETISDSDDGSYQVTNGIYIEKDIKIKSENSTITLDSNKGVKVPIFNEDGSRTEDFATIKVVRNSAGQLQLMLS